MDFHTGSDYLAPLGTRVVAARGGTVVHVNYGAKALGNHQFVIRPGDGTEDFYAHTRTRPGNGITVVAGQALAEVGNEGNSTGPHLHFERHKGFGWACSLMDDPMKSHNAQAGTTSSWAFASGQQVYQKYLKWKGHEQNSDGKSDSIKCWQEMLNHHSLQGGQELPTTGQWFEMTASETQKCQTQHIPPADTPLEAVFVGSKQFEHVRSSTGCPYVWVAGEASATPNPPEPPVSEAPPQPALMAPGAIWDPIPKKDGGYFTGLRQFTGSAKKVTLHTTESSIKPPWEQMQKGIPHFTMDLLTGRIWQHLPLYMAAYTLQGGEHSPNSDSGTNIQVEMIGFAAQSPNWSTDYYEMIEILLHWCGDYLLVPYAFPCAFADANNYTRLTWEQWEPLSGVLGHQHAPYNDHWDPGALDVKRLTRDSIPPPSEEPIPPEQEGRWEELWERYGDYIWVLVIAILLAVTIYSLV